MTPLIFTLVIFVVSVFAGAFGSLLGLGGGVIVVPVLTLAFHIDIRYAIGASIVSVIATSSGAAAAYVRDHMTNLRLAMLLEIGTTSGALTGAFLAGIIKPNWLFVIFGLLLGASAAIMARKRHGTSGRIVPRDRWADALRLHGEYFDPADGHTIAYRVSRTPLGLGLMYVAGILSGLLGIGSGVLKVPAMDLAMGMPIKASTATSNFMIGVTAAASAGVYFIRGNINPFIAGPVAAGILLGATVGSRMLGQLRSRSIRMAFVIVLGLVAAQMVYKGMFPQ